MTDARREAEDRAVEKTLLASYCPAPIKVARARQDELLRARYEGQALNIADIGCGDGYHGSIFAPAGGVYHGFEIAPELAAMARRRWADEGLHNARIFEGDVADADLPERFYDLVWCLYFTPGNFRDPADDVAFYTDAYLDRNPAFVRIFARFMAAMKPGSTVFLTVYKDVPEAEEAQFDFYEHTGQHPITPRGSRFVMTAENFWSVRWTRESMLSNLAAIGVPAPDVAFHDLNEIAWLVEFGSGVSRGPRSGNTP